MSRAQGHIANVLCVLFDHVIESQRQNRLNNDSEMMTGKLLILFLFSLLLLNQNGQGN